MALLHAIPVKVMKLDMVLSKWYARKLVEALIAATSIASKDDSFEADNSP